LVMADENAAVWSREGTLPGKSRWHVMRAVLGEIDVGAVTKAGNNEWRRNEKTTKGRRRGGGAGSREAKEQGQTLGTRQQPGL